MSRTTSRTKSKGGDVRSAARKALTVILEPLAGFVLDTGVSAHEFEELFRVAVVRSAADRQKELTGRLSISGIAAVTGIPRAEISRILKTKEKDTFPDAQQQATNRILSAWHEDPKYTDTSGLPAELPIFAPSPSFDALVRAHGRGIPTRAMLDELVRTGSVEVLSSRRVKAKSLVAVDHGVGPLAVKSFGDRGADLLRTMLLNIRHPERFRFVSSVEGSVGSADFLPVFRKEVSSRGQNFLAGVRETLFSNATRDTRAGIRQTPVRASVTVYYGESDQRTKKKQTTKEVRRNYRRKADRS